MLKKKKKGERGRERNSCFMSLFLVRLWSRSLVERALDEESKMWALYHLQRVPSFPWASVSSSVMYAGSFCSKVQSLQFLLMP